MYVHLPGRPLRSTSLARRSSSFAPSSGRHVSLIISKPTERRHPLERVVASAPTESWSEPESEVPSCCPASTASLGSAASLSSRLFTPLLASPVCHALHLRDPGLLVRVAASCPATWTLRPGFPNTHRRLVLCALLVEGSKTAWKGVAVCRRVQGWLGPAALWV